MAHTLEALAAERAWYVERFERIAAEIDRRWDRLKDLERQIEDCWACNDPSDDLEAEARSISMPRLFAEDPDDEPYRDWPGDRERFAIVAQWAQEEGLLEPGGAARFVGFKALRTEVSDAILARCLEALNELPVDEARPLRFGADAGLCDWALGRGLITKAEYGLVASERGSMFNYAGD